jgi:hypothetical protein
MADSSVQVRRAITAGEERRPTSLFVAVHVKSLDASGIERGVRALWIARCLR